MPATQNHAGRTFGRITLAAPVPGKSGYWKGTCSCGNPVEKRLDNLKRPGDHSCGKCLAPAPTADTHLEERVRRLEQVIAAINPDLLPRPTPTAMPSPSPSLTSSVASEVRRPDQPLIPSVASEVSEPDSAPEPRTSQFSRVTYDADGDLWESRTLSGRVFFWGASEEEAAYAARVYLELIHCTLNHRIIPDAELTLSEERREEIRVEVIEAL
jgi:hypothetical protein